MHSVIVKAYKDEPVRLSALEVHPNYVLVAGRDVSKTIGFPRDCVFQFDESLFRKLVAAYSRGNPQELDRLWQKATRYEN